MPEINFFWDPVEDNIVQERDETGAVVADYTTEPYLYGDLVSQRRDGQSSFYCFDGLGSTLALTNATGVVTDTTAYTAFGELTEQTGGTVNPFEYIGQKGYFRDDLTGAYGVRRRTLWSSRGIWLSADPAQHLDRVGAYQYALNRPQYFSDPRGLYVTAMGQRCADCGSCAAPEDYCVFGIWAALGDFAIGNRQPFFPDDPKTNTIILTYGHVCFVRTDTRGKCSADFDRTPIDKTRPETNSYIDFVTDSPDGLICRVDQTMFDESGRLIGEPKPVRGGGPDKARICKDCVARIPDDGSMPFHLFDPTPGRLDEWWSYFKGWHGACIFWRRALGTTICPRLKSIRFLIRLGWTCKCDDTHFVNKGLFETGDIQVDKRDTR